MKIKQFVSLSMFAMFIVSLSLLFLVENKSDCYTAGVQREIETILIDAGHGGEDGGAIGVGGMLEKEINLSVAKKLEIILNLCGINTEMTRRSDEALFFDSAFSLQKRKSEDIKKRVEQVHKTPGAVLISIHQNSFPEGNCSGAQVFFSDGNERSKPLAKTIQNTLREGIDKENRRSEKKSDKTIYLLENVNCPAVLVECGFLTNPAEAQLLRRDTYRTKLATCIACGFLRYKEEK